MQPGFAQRTGVFFVRRIGAKEQGNRDASVSFILCPGRECGLLGVTDRLQYEDSFFRLSELP
jgi:hypothetical protein